MKFNYLLMYGEKEVLLIQYSLAAVDMVGMMIEKYVGVFLGTISDPRITD